MKTSKRARVIRDAYGQRRAVRRQGYWTKTVRRVGCRTNIELLLQPNATAVAGEDTKSDPSSADGVGDDLRDVSRRSPGPAEGGVVDVEETTVPGTVP